jgi:hypothetical protein
MLIPRAHLRRRLGLLARAAIFTAIFSAGSLVVQPGVSADDGAQLLGDWRGESVCQVRPSSCNDEKALYHISRSPDDSFRFVMRMDKIVDGKPVTMGTLDYKYDKEKGTLVHEDARGIWKFTVKGNKMEGTLTLPTGVLYRRISLTKD